MTNIAIDPGLFFFRREKPFRPHEVSDDETTLVPEVPKIRCPQCRWHPRRSSRWICVDVSAPENFSGGCGAVWHTFETGGICPGCSHRWAWTSCLSCGRWLLHGNWYAAANSD